MFKMRPSLLPVVLLTTITLSSSNVLPILTINKLETEPLLEDQNRPDNTFNNKHKVNPNIFYKVFIGTTKDNLPKKSQISRLKIFDNDNNQIRAVLEDLDADDDYNSEGFRKEQWHNYPRRLDRLNKNLIYRQFEKEPLDNNDSETTDKDTRNEFDGSSRDDTLEGYDSGIIDGPLLIFKIRLAYLVDNINKANTNKNLYDIQDGSKDDDSEISDDNKTFNPNDVSSIVKVKRKEKSREVHQFTEKSSNENKSVKKRIFSLWSRLQSLSHRGHELQHRRHLYAFYGLPEDGGSALTAETRATFLRPPGSPLSFWGSSCSWRVRAALHFKNIVFEEKSIDIVREQKQLTDEYRAINPSQKVPAIVMDGVTIVESMAILQYLEDTHPQRSLQPNTPLLRARMREICETIVSGIQPLQNIGLKKHFDSEQKHKEFSKYFTTRGLETLEDLLKKTAGKFCIEDQITMADLCLVPQVYNGIVRHQLNIKEYPTVADIYEALLKEKTFIETHPENIKRKG